MSLAATFTLGAEAANARKVTVQLGSRATRGAGPKDLTSKRALELYLSSDAAGDVVVNAATTGIAPTDGGAGVLLQGPVSGEQAIWLMKTDADGLLEITLTNAGDENETVYVNVKDPTTGKVLTSGAVAFADDTP